MHKPTHLLVTAFLCAFVSSAQKTDTLVLFYKSDQYSISRQDKQRLDSFITQGWDRMTINGYTDETDEEDYNLELSMKRAREVFNYFVTKKIDSTSLYSQFFGESRPVADNISDDGRAMNRRTEIIGYRVPRISIRPKDQVDPMKPVTMTLNNGVMITYRPANMPDWLISGLEGGWIYFNLLSNTRQMRQWNLWNNTTNGEILSSVMIMCGKGFNPCKLDSPILVKVPIPVSTKCPIEKVKFFNAVAERGKQIWQEQSKELFPETINGQQFISVWMDDFCQCINFDFKIDPDCFDTDSTQIMYVNANIKNMSAELKGLNSVYMPRKINDTTHTLLYLKDKLDQAALSFGLYNGKRRIMSFYDQPVGSFPYDERKGLYILSTGQYSFYFPKLKVFDVVLKVNGTKYRAYPDKNKCDIVYLNRTAETILVDFSIQSRGGLIQYKDQPIGSIPVDIKTGNRVIDKNYLKVLKVKGAVAGIE